MDHVEDLCIDHQHEQQRRQHPSEKVKVNHVVHADDVLELAGDDQVRADGAVLLKAPQIVPAQHGSEPHDEGHRPAHHHRQPRSPRGHHAFVPGSTASRQALFHLEEALFYYLDQNLYGVLFSAKTLQNKQDVCGLFKIQFTFSSH